MSRPLTDREYIGTLLSKPPFGGIDTPLLNFLRNTAHSQNGVKLELCFYNDAGTAIIHADIITGHSPRDLRAGAVLLALQEYMRITGDHIDWHTAKIGDHFAITSDELNASIASDHSEFIHLLMASNLSPMQALKLAIDTILTKNDNGQMVTKDDMNNAFLPVHTALLNQETTIVLKDSKGQEVKPQTSRSKLLSGMRRALFKPD